LGEVFEPLLPAMSPDGNGAHPTSAAGGAGQASQDQTAEASVLKAARAEAAAACAQRDIARVAARRAAAAAEGHWRGTLAEMERQAAEWQRRANAAEQQAIEWQQHADAAEQRATEWQQRYEGLHARLEAFLRRFWILRAARLIPEPGRRFVRQKLLGWGCR
jgi:hypothetical protein